MNTLQEIILIFGSLALLTAGCAVMGWVVVSDNKKLDRRREEWIARGSIPEDEPRTY